MQSNKWHRLKVCSVLNQLKLHVYLRFSDLFNMYYLLSLYVNDIQSTISYFDQKESRLQPVWQLQKPRYGDKNEEHALRMTFLYIFRQLLILICWCRLVSHGYICLYPDYCWEAWIHLVQTCIHWLIQWSQYCSYKDHFVN